MFSSKASAFTKLFKLFALVLSIFALIACSKSGGGSGSSSSKNGDSSSSSSNANNNGGSNSSSSNVNNPGGTTSTGIGTVCPTEQSISINSSKLFRFSFSKGSQCELQTYDGKVKQFTLSDNLRRPPTGVKTAVDDDYYFNDYANITLKQLGITKDEALSSYITCNGDDNQKYFAFIDVYSSYVHPHTCQLYNITFSLDDGHIIGRPTVKIEFVLFNNDHNNNDLVGIKCGLSKNGKEVIPKTNTNPINLLNNDKYSAYFEFDTTAVTPTINVVDKITFECVTTIGKTLSFDDYARDGTFGRAIN